ncbi:hypothetical protein K432DRAFT_395039 [Lepidopterella palustris CBS 459.81]|uniref:F-box domain-containing protein n=1 Tax=Lepidopterella palustris CBS 459.81 TaxID=1314670 RepID=A0A8E2E6K7_9PEZI|nr:hypothetical protein K432DRAFT_395039 [Lepidopterella palustris CBS 459.81]
MNRLPSVRSSSRSLHLNLLFKIIVSSLHLKKADGIDPARKKDMRSKMRVSKKKPFRFLDLPVDIRIMIYSLVLGWPRLSQIIKKLTASEPGEVGQTRRFATAVSRSRPRPVLVTPSILLINHQITGEALEELLRTTLILDMPSACVPMLYDPFEVTDFISIGLLKRCRRVVIAVNTDVTLGEDLMTFCGDEKFWQPWDHWLSFLFQDVWSPDNHDLDKLTVRIGGCLQQPGTPWNSRGNYSYNAWTNRPKYFKHYREEVLQILHYSLRSLGKNVTISIQGPNGVELPHLMRRLLKGRKG